MIGEAEATEANDASNVPAFCAFKRVRTRHRVHLLRERADARERLTRTGDDKDCQLVYSDTHAGMH